MSITIKSNVPGFISGLDKLAKKQLPFAASKALNTIAKRIAYRESPDELEKVIDRPTANTKKSIKVLKYAHKNLLSALVGVPDTARYRYMKNVVGKKEDTGRFFPTHKKFTSRFGGFNYKYAMKSVGSNSKIFIRDRNGRKAIFQRMGGKKNSRLRMVAAFSKNKERDQLFYLEKVAERVLQRDFRKTLANELDKAIKTAR